MVSDQTGDKALLYAERIIDRIINKARGILPFNSFIMAVIALELRSISNAKASLLLLLSMLLLSISSFVLLVSMFWAHFRKPNEFETIKLEFDLTVDLIRRRGICLQLAIILSCVGFAIAIIAIGVQLLSSIKLTG